MRNEIIVMSDIHLGTKDSKAKEAVNFLKQNPCDTLILNGDIVDGWALKRGSTWKNKHMDFIRYIMKLTETGTNVIWLRGNHDDFLKDFIPFTLGNMEFREDYVISSGGKSYYVLHGDVFDVFVTKMKWIAKIGSIGYDLALWVNRWYNRYREFRGKPYFSLSKRIKNSVKLATNFVNDFENHIVHLAKINKYNGVICGHIHSPIIKEIDGIEYLNSGDWVENMSALILNNGKWKLINYTEKEV